MLLYRTLRAILRGAVNVFFVDIEAEDAFNVPDEGPVIFAANHPNSIMDTVILGTQIDRQIHYMARSGLFKNPLVAWLFDRCGVIPIYRPRDAKGAFDSDKNRSAFDAAYDLLGHGNCLGIFPEGRNAPERHVRDVKTGTARIALGAEKEYGYELGVKIVPVGLNFEDRDRFLSRVLVRFGEPIEVSEYAERHREAPRETVRALTDEIQSGLRAVAVHIAEERSIQLVEDVHRIYGRNLFHNIERTAAERPDLHSDYLDRIRADVSYEPGLEDKFYLKQRIADALEFHERRHPDRVADLRNRIRTFRENLEQVRLRFDFMDRPPDTMSRRREAAKLTAYTIVFAPLFLWGFVNNILPFALTRAIAMRAPDEAMRAFTGLIAGSLSFGLFYTLQSWGVFVLTGSPWLAVAYVVSLPFAGLFALRYRRQVARYRDRIVVRTMFASQSKLLDQLVTMRESIIEELEELREEFMQAESDKREFEHGRQEAGGGRPEVAASELTGDGR